MSPETRGFIDVDQLMPQISIEQVAAFYGVKLSEITRRGSEIRAKCFLNCGFGEETGSRALAINAESPAKRWKCHQYGCSKAGNLVSLCDLLKPGIHSDGRPRGQRFKEIARDLLAMTGDSPPEVSPKGGSDRVLSQGAAGPVAAAPRPAESTPAPGSPTRPAKERTEKRKANEEQPVNAPLAKSPIEKARGLVNLDEKFVRDIADMPPGASKYFRTRPFLSLEACQKWRMGYLPMGTAGDRSGGTMRGKVVYPMLSEAGDVLTWFGRDPEFEKKHAEWRGKGKYGKEPEKFRFIKGFHRGLELFGQHGSRLREPGYRETLQELGLVVVEGPNDVIRLDALGVPAVGLCSNQITDAQAGKIAKWAKRLANGRVTLMLDGDEPGQAGAKHALFELVAKHRVDVCVVPLESEPEKLTDEQWQKMRSQLAREKPRHATPSRS